LYVVRKWPLLGRSPFGCGYCAMCISCKVCKVPTYRQDHSCVVKTFSENWCLCKQKSSGHLLTMNMTFSGFGSVFCIVLRNQQKLQLRSYRCRKQCGGFCISVWCFLAINVCNHGEHYEMPSM
jgi:hypothetical protein